MRHGGAGGGRRSSVVTLAIASHPRHSGHPMAKTVSLINLRGGVGRSTLTVALARHFAGHGTKNVLVVDLDPQSGASVRALGADRYAHEVMSGTGSAAPEPLDGPEPARALVHVACYGPARTRFDLLPSRGDRLLSTATAGESAQALGQLVTSVRDRYDLILVDSAASLSPVTAAAYLASDFVLVPMRPGAVAALDMPALGRWFADIPRHHGGGTPVAVAVVFNDASGEACNDAQPRLEARAQARRLGWSLLRSEIGHSPVLDGRGTDPFPLDGARANDALRAIGALAAEVAAVIGL